MVLYLQGQGYTSRKGQNVTATPFQNQLQSKTMGENDVLLKAIIFCNPSVLFLSVMIKKKRKKKKKNKNAHAIVLLSSNMSYQIMFLPLHLRINMCKMFLPLEFKLIGFSFADTRHCTY